MTVRTHPAGCHPPGEPSPGAKPRSRFRAFRSQPFGRCSASTTSRQPGAAGSPSSTVVSSPSGTSAEVNPSPR